MAVQADLAEQAEKPEAVEATLDLTTVLMAEVPMAVTAVVPMVATFAIMSKGTPTRVKFAEVVKYPEPLKNLRRIEVNLYSFCSEYSSLIQAFPNLLYWHKTLYCMSS